MKSRPTDTESSAIAEAAAEWFVRRRDGLSPEAEASYQAWEAADPRHAAAIAEIQDTWKRVSFPLTGRRKEEVARILNRRAAVQRARPYVLAAAGIAIAAALAFSWPMRPRTIALPVATVAVQPNIERLPDGSTAELNAGAEIAIEFTSERRTVRLLQGEVLFSVVKDVARPFVVAVREVEVRAVGTAFAVRYDPQGVGVLVTEGQVAVEHVGPNNSRDASEGQQPSPLPPIYLSAGRQVALAIDRLAEVPPVVKPVSPEEIEAALAWRTHRLEFSRMPLSEAIALFNRQNRVQLSIADAATGTIPVSGVFWSNDSEAFVRLLESGLGVRSERSGDTIVLTSR